MKRFFVGCQLFSGCVLAATLTACAWTADDDVLDVALVGEPVALAGVQRINGALKDVHLLVAPDGAPWLAFSNGDGLWEARLRPPAQGFMRPQVRAAFPSSLRSLCVVDNGYRAGAAERHSYLSLRRPGEQRAFELEAPYGKRGIAWQMLCADNAMAYFTQSPPGDEIHVLRRLPSGSLASYRVPWPTHPPQDAEYGPVALNDAGTELFIVDDDFHLLVHHLDTGQVRDLGVEFWYGLVGEYFFYLDDLGDLNVYDIAARRSRPLGVNLSPDGTVMGIDSDRLALLSCDWDGVRSTPFALDQKGRPAAAARVLDPDPCYASSSTLSSYSGVLVYTRYQETRAVPLDGSAPPRVLFRHGGQQILGVCQDRAVAYSLDPTGRYGKGVGDGWIGTWRFMERGRDVQFSPDCRRVRFKEHAADLRKIGELRSAELPGGTPLRLARNVSWYQELPDGRILAAANTAVVGPQTRLLLIDEERRVARPLLTGIDGMTGALALGTLVPGANDVLLEFKVIDGYSGSEIGAFLLHLQLPPRE